ncbi:hypothetical protein [Bdellovibrio reynosensis]|uniref:Lipoprotein n=1 Tax=Bdellovibrio reynosensis TaxID=2835041 RepID=A0ABY4C6E8_9BACT|nr:hypothetical protein [Bdellovibrio reynosensis]UOF00548.1 hypothetical protein MNR06_12650 [Bdellovibrio reynosensis]
MNKAQTKIIIFFILAVLSACTFSNPEEKAVKKPNIIIKAPLTSLQKSILIAIEKNNIEALKGALESATPADLSFEGHENTPMGIALKNNFLEITQELIKRNIDLFSLGGYEETFRRNSFNYNVQRVHLNFDWDPDKLEFRINVSEKYYLAKIREKVRLFYESNTHSPEALINQSKMPCYLFESQTILQNLTGKNFEKIIKNLVCKDSLNAHEVNVLYEVALFKGFKNLYNTPEFISYLSRHSLLKSLYYKMNYLNVYLAPGLLYKVANSKENYAINPSFCEHSSELEALKEDLSYCAGHISVAREKGADEFLKENRILSPPFEMIRGRDNGSYQTVKTVKYTSGSFYQFNILFENEDTHYSLISILMNSYWLSDWGRFHRLAMAPNAESKLNDPSPLPFKPGEYLNKRTKDGAEEIAPLTSDFEPPEDFESF